MPNQFDDYGSRHLSFDACEHLAKQIRARIGCSGDNPVPHISEVLDRLGIVPVVRSMSEMDDALALAKPATQDIYIREDVTEHILKDSPLARFSMLHELAHLADHKHVTDHGGVDELYRKASGNRLLSFYSTAESVEGQADSIADAVAMPLEMVKMCGDARELARIARMPLERAFVRFNLISTRSARMLSSIQRSAVAELHARNASTPAERLAREYEAMKLRLWAALPELAGEDATVIRRCGQCQIRWSEFGKTSGCGWFIEGEEIKSYFAIRHGL